MTANRRPRPPRLALLAPALLLLAGCFGNADAPRLVQPELGPAPATAAPVGTDRPALRLRAVRASSLLEARIVWRSSAVEVGYYEQERWTDPPATYVERALERELFQRRGWIRTDGPAPWSLDIEVRAFEEVLLPEHAVRIVLAVALEDDAQRARLVREVEVVRPVPEDGLEPMAKAMGGALVEAATRVADLVAAAAPPPP